MIAVYNKTKGGFSLIEMMVAMTILSGLMLILTMLLDQVQESWRNSESRIGQFREARVAFDVLTKNLSQASLNTYYDLKDEDPKDGIIDGYFRTSELQFVNLRADSLDVGGGQTPVGHGVFFQAPLGFSNGYRNLNNIFNGRGYLVTFGGDRKYRPEWIQSAERYRFRLMEFRPPAEGNQVFADGGRERLDGEPQDFTSWYKQKTNVSGFASEVDSKAPEGEPPTQGQVPQQGEFEDHLNPLAENIILLVVSPRDTLEPSSGGRKDTASTIAPNYSYDSNDTSDNFTQFAQQVPPLVRVTMVAIDEGSAVRNEDGSQMPNMIPDGLFRSTTSYEKDVQELSEFLNEERINHKVFSSMVMLRSAKWSDNS